MTKALPPTFFLLALVAMAVLHVLWPVARYWDFPLTLTGLVPLMCGIALNLAADRQFKRQHTPVHPFEQPTALLEVFPFSISRNPMYLGLTLMLVGVALLFGTVSPVLPAVGFAVLVDRRFVKLEERTMAARFGADWARYRARVRRWL
jgi:protein-S-isoprenylcysteine O-methyltransferase Ste14